MKSISKKILIYFICFTTKLLGVQIFKSLMTIKVAYTHIICVTLEDPHTFLDIPTKTVSLRRSSRIKFFLLICRGNLVLMAYLVLMLTHVLRNFIIQKFINENFVKECFVIEQKYALSIITIKKIFKFKSYAKICILRIKNIIRIN